GGRRGGGRARPPPRPPRRAAGTRPSRCRRRRPPRPPRCVRSSRDVRRASRRPLPTRMLGAHRYHAGMLTGRVVLVTAGGAGIGRAISLGLEDAHATVAVVEGDFASRSATEAAFPAARAPARPPR